MSATVPAETVVCCETLFDVMASTESASSVCICAVHSSQMQAAEVKKREATEKRKSQKDKRTKKEKKHKRHKRKKATKRKLVSGAQSARALFKCTLVSSCNVYHHAAFVLKGKVTMLLTELALFVFSCRTCSSVLRDPGCFLAHT